MLRRLRSARVIFISFIVLMLGAAPAFALSLDEAKSRGLVGEKFDGYIAAVAPSPNAEVQALISSINQGRKSEYQNIAKKNGTTTEAVEALAGKKAIEKTPGGQYVQLTPGSWNKK